MDPTRAPLLRRIERERPEWIESAGPIGEPVRTPGGAFVVTIPSSDRRPDVELEISRNEALVRVGRHEQLFVWHPGEAEEAEEEVIAYTERITRSGSDPDSLSLDAVALTAEQLELLIRIDELLRERGAV